MERIEDGSQSITQQASNRLGIEDDDIFEEVEIHELEGDDEEPKAKNTRKSSGTRSNVWAYYIKAMDGEGDEKIKKGQCKRCGRLIRADPNRNGTTALKNHTTSYLKKHQAIASQSVLNLQPTTDGTGSLTSWKFDQNVVRMALCQMIIMDELPFRFVEHEGFKMFIEAACPMFKIPGRQTVRADCMRLFLERKVILKTFFKLKAWDECRSRLIVGQGSTTQILFVSQHIALTRIGNCIKR
ncbi:uncharacterized protein LOC131003309 [Salvia miltiorrhiza]|uniref:uncharacterized protein LOC131003309 n=1 Tax=Salvia miltiorrhiza TaxID=226208 RepID=UPI0025AC930A|nr:uncharacterized protein LOC131003309 [Salvia miltiorrhiza]